MGIKDFFKKIFSEDVAEKVEEKPVEKRKISSLKDFESFLDETSQDLEKENKAILKTVREKVKIFVSESKEEVKRLRGLDLEKRREEQRLKNIVVENFNVYLEHLERFLDELDDLDLEILDDYFAKIDVVFRRFDSNSGMNFEKAIVLFGQDLKNIKNKISTFLSDASFIKKENSELFDKNKELKEYGELILEVKSLIDSTSKTNEEIQYLNNSLESLRKEIKEREEEIIKIEACDDCKKELKEKEDFENEREDMKKSASELKKKVGFKELLKKFHGHEKSYELIKEYSDKFLETLEKDEDLAILEILGEEYGFLKEDFINLREKLSKINKGLELIIEKEIEELKKQISSLEAQIKDKEKEIVIETKKIEKFDSRKKEIFSQIKKSKLFKNLEFDFNLLL
ncbi:MAG: hypothetical protein WC796_02245 [Candidatus Pacearchaeota archaeon]|jgi:predicted  nucleic acid-binding Zn-ribbon protein